MMDSIEAMAVEFSSKLQKWMTPDEMAKVIRLNEEEADSSICHSHDFCDANMALHEVFMRHGMDVTDEGGVALYGSVWGKVWDSARVNRFWFLHSA